MTSPASSGGAVCLLARAPSAPGKTRLTTGLSTDRAVALRRALLLDTLESALDAGLPVVVCYTPATARNEMASVVSEVISAGVDRLLVSVGHPFTGCRVLPQANGDLGARMHAAFTDVFALGAERVVLIGSDLPTLPPEHLVAAMTALDRAPVVIGPAEDGGYYLLGLREPREGLFEGIAWGTCDVLAQTTGAAERLGCACELLPAWHDVDAPADLARVVPPRARHTRAWLENPT